MPKFNKTEGELETMFDKWMFVLHNLGCLLDRPKALQDRVFQKLFEQAEIARYSDLERRQYFESQKEYWDNYSILTTAEKKGRAEGLAEGIAQGRADERLTIARGMKVKGYATKDIEEITGLTADEIDKL